MGIFRLTKIVHQMVLYKVEYIKTYMSLFTRPPITTEVIGGLVIYHSKYYVVKIKYMNILKNLKGMI